MSSPKLKYTLLHLVRTLKALSGGGAKGYSGNIAENNGEAKGFIKYKIKYLKLIYSHSHIICVGKRNMV